MPVQGVTLAAFPYLYVVTRILIQSLLCLVYGPKERDVDRGDGGYILLCSITREK